MGWFGRRWQREKPLQPNSEETGPAVPREPEAFAYLAAGDEKSRKTAQQSRPPDAATIEAAVKTDTVTANEALATKNRSIERRPVGPYADTKEHLSEELERIDLLIRAETLRWRAMIAAHKPEHLWGMLQVSDAEADAYLRWPFSPRDVLPDDLDKAFRPCCEAAAAAGSRIAARRRATPRTTELRVQSLKTVFGLSELERDILLVCLLPELDGRYRRLFGYLQDDASRDRPSVELVLQVLAPLIGDLGEARALFEPTARLFEYALLVSNADAELPLSMRLLRIDDRIVDYLLGGDQIDGRLAGLRSRLAAPCGWDQLVGETEHIERLRRIAEGCRDRRRSDRPLPVLFLHGGYGSGRLDAARAVCTDAATPLLIHDIEVLVQAPAGWDQTVVLAFREAMLRSAALYWRGCEALLEPGQPTYRWLQLIGAAETFSGLTFLASETIWEPSGRFRDRPFIRLDFAEPSFELRRRLWATHLPEADAFAAPSPDRDLLAELLANAFQLTQGQIVDAVAAARWLALARDGRAPGLTVDDLYESCRRHSGRRLLTFARRIEPRTDLTFDDLIIPATNGRQLNELRQRIRLRSHVYSGLGFERRLSLGKGLIALFTGSSGTGKTMAAELLAREQGVDLYKVDLSAVVSKYVGETEKNLARVFSEAEDANAIILFDEADALFGKRGEVREAQDRWANMEINYLLQRVEEYAGTVVLTSNLRQNIDEAFLRRIHVIVDFPFPDADARARILTGLFPEGITPPPANELQHLAERFKLAGGSFKNIVVDAAFRALTTAGRGTPRVTTRQLVAATAREYQKLGKPITKGEFGEAFYGWLEEDIL